MNSPARFAAMFLVAIAATLVSADAKAALWLPTSEPPYYLWSTPGNWSPPAIPTILDAVFVNNGGDANIYSNAFCGYLSLGAGHGDPASSGSIYLDANLSTYANFNGSEYIGDSGLGYIQQWAGTNNAATAMYLGYSIDASGSYSLNAGAVTAPYLYVGINGHASFVQSDGVVSVANEMDVFSQNYNVSYNLTGGSLIVPVEHVGDRNTATFTQSSGTHDVTSYIYLGGPTNGTGAYNLSGNGLLVTPSLVVGNNPGGTGIFTQSGGTVTANSTLYVAYLASSAGTYSLVSGSVSAPYQYIGGYGSGLFKQSGGTNSVSQELDLGSGTGGFGEYSLIGSGLLAVNSLTVGGLASANFTQTAGTVSGTNQLALGYYSASANGYYSLNAGSLYMPYEFVGVNGAGNITQNGGVNSIANGLYLNYNNGSIGAYNLVGGSLAAPDEYLGNASTGTATITQLGGTNSTTFLELGLFGNGASATGIYHLNGGLLHINGLGIGTSSPNLFTFSGGTFQAGTSFTTFAPMQLSGTSTFDTSGNSLTLSGVLSGSGSLHKKGAGLLALTASNTFTGGLVIGAGTVSSVYPLPGTVTFTNDPVLQAASAAFSINSNVVIDVNATAVIDTNGYTVLDSGGISGAGGLTKTGSGTLILNSANTFSGDTVVSQGTLQVTNPAALQNSNVVVNVDGGLQFNAGPTSGTISLAGLSGNNSVSLTSGGVPIVLSVGGNNADTTFSGVLNGSGTLAKAGTGSLYLSGSSSWTGGLMLDPGIVAINSDAALGAVPPSPANNIRFVANATLQARNTVSLAANRNISIALGSTASFDPSGGSFTIAGGISGSGALAEIGAGTLILSGTNTYAGGTTAAAGVLKITSKYALRDGSNLNIGSGLAAFPAPVVPESVIATELMPVPEPGTLALLAAGGIAGLAVRRRKWKTNSKSEI